MGFNRKPTREWLLRDDTSSTMAPLKDIFKRKQYMRMRDKIEWFWMLPMHSFRATFHKRKMTKKG